MKHGKPKIILIGCGLLLVSVLTGWRLLPLTVPSVIIAGVTYIVALTAAVVDFKTHTIPNILPLTLCAARIIVSVVLAVLEQAAWPELLSMFSRQNLFLRGTVSGKQRSL